MAEPAAANATSPAPVVTVGEPTCQTCPFSAGEPRTRGRGTLQYIECRTGSRPRPVTVGYFCSQHPGRQRDRLAARAMQALMSRPSGWGPEDAARIAYRTADAMLREGGHADSDGDVSP